MQQDVYCPQRPICLGRCECALKKKKEKKKQKGQSNSDMDESK